MGTENNGARWWAEIDTTMHDTYANEHSANGKAFGHTHSSMVVELSADASQSTATSGIGILKKSGSGFLRGLGRKKKSSASIADEDNRDANSQAGEYSIHHEGSGVVAEDAYTDKRKGMGSLLVGLGRRRKSSGSMSEHAQETSPVPAESILEEQPRKPVGGLLGRVQRAKERSRKAEDAGLNLDTAHDDAGSTRDQGIATYTADAQYSTQYVPTAAADVRVFSTADASTAEYADEQQQRQQHIQYEEHAHQQQQDEHSHGAQEDEQGLQQAHPSWGLLARTRSANITSILGRPKDATTAEPAQEAEQHGAQEQLTCGTTEAEAAAAEAAAAAAAAAAAMRIEPQREPPIRKFPRGFLWGTATSAYQIEGAYLDEGKGMSIWDAFCHTPGKISGNANADISTCHFYRFKEDVALMKAMGVKCYRMSIAWSRIFPNGKGKVNERGVAFYDRLINELISNKIMPMVTLYHWDLPLALQIEEDGWMNPKIVDYFVKYAKLCFSRFGDRVKYWVTINEPWCAAVLGHDSGGQHAPGRTVDPAREVYKVAHHMLIAHGRAYQMYQRLFKKKQRGKIGLALNGDWYEAKPAADLEEQRCNEKAAERALEFTLGWFARPVYQGDYPSLMRERCGNRLPLFTAEQRQMLQGSVDFFGLNHYSSHLCEQPTWYKELAAGDDDDSDREHKLMKLGAQLERMMSHSAAGSVLDSHESEIQEGDVADVADDEAQVVQEDEEAAEDPYIESTGYWQDISVDQSDDDVWKTTDMGWGVYPEGMRKVLNYIQKEFNPRGGIIVTENGCAVAEDDVNEALKDIERAVYLKRYLTEIHKAILHDDVDVRGYFVWSLLDNFEWGYGYQKKFGLHYVDMQTLERIPKLSANWYAEVIRKNRLENYSSSSKSSSSTAASPSSTSS